ncbi:hypothetical protein A1E_03010 [Rickettsia canadensis str. McKiel]|uniref:Uncharacterized protein n=1 Tax=Rickettsia canadensis (strain McKiel) TaxID=293613 RepID=A8EYV9_RICCK|nr:hypothetical protein A1E_03010 [Rickettsia canadensis str. McKiel]
MKENILVQAGGMWWTTLAIYLVAAVGVWAVSQEQAAFYQGLVLHLVDSLQKAVRLNKAHIVGDCGKPE